MFVCFAQIVAWASNIDFVDFVLILQCLAIFISPLITLFIGVDHSPKYELFFVLGAAVAVSYELMSKMRGNPTFIERAISTSFVGCYYVLRGYENLPIHQEADAFYSLSPALTFVAVLPLLTAACTRFQ